MGERGFQRGPWGRARGPVQCLFPSSLSSRVIPASSVSLLCITSSGILGTFGLIIGEMKESLTLPLIFRDIRL